MTWFFGCVPKNVNKMVLTFEDFLADLEILERTFEESVNPKFN